MWPPDDLFAPPGSGRNRSESLWVKAARLLCVVVFLSILGLWLASIWLQIGPLWTVLSIAVAIVTVVAFGLLLIDDRMGRL